MRRRKSSPEERGHLHHVVPFTEEFYSREEMRARRAVVVNDALHEAILSHVIICGRLLQKYGDGTEEGQKICAVLLAKRQQLEQAANKLSRVTRKLCEEAGI